MAGIFDIACLGTSLTAGTGSDGAGGLPYGSYTPVLAAALAPVKSSYVRTYNFGSGGSISTGAIANFLPRVLDVKPRALLVELLTNDCIGPAIGGLSLADSTTNHLTIINACRALPNPPQIFLVTMNPVIGSSYSATARTGIDIYNKIYRTLAVSHQVGLIDTFPKWKATSADIPDGVHPTLTANIAQLIPQLVAALSPLIA
jgi:lysophospholipase L1-like esterase